MAAAKKTKYGIGCMYVCSKLFASTSLVMAQTRGNCNSFNSWKNIEKFETLLFLKKKKERFSVDAEFSPKFHLHAPNDFPISKKLVFVHLFLRS